MDEFDKNFIKNMSPLLITAVVMFFLMVAYETNADDNKIIGYTEHGIPVTKAELEVKSFNFNNVRGQWDWNKKTNTLRLSIGKSKKIDITFSNRCWDMEYATGLKFEPWMKGSSFISKGDKIIPIGWTNRTALYPCTIKRITEVIEEKEDGEEN
jgi:hypothetical protein